MILIDGKKTAAEFREELKKEVSELKSKYNKVPGLTVILVGEDPPSKIYVKNKEKFAKEIGMNSEALRYPADLEEIKGNIALFNLTEATAKKIHTQFGHARSERVKKLVTDAGVKDEKFLKLLDDIEDSCETCKRYKKPKPRPAVALALTEEFNGVVSVDLKDVGADKIFHMIDNATRYSGAALIKNKR